MNTRIRPLKRLGTVFLMLSVNFVSACVSYSPEEVMSKFYSNDGPEDSLMDPLIISGEKVVPVVLEKVKDKDMPRRRYAIGFLGNGSYKQALPSLKNILQDKTEKDYFRGDALHAIYQIDDNSWTAIRKNLQRRWRVSWKHIRRYTCQ